MPDANPSTHSERSSASGPARLDPNANRADSAKFREEILRRYDAPYTLAWSHGGLNE